MPPPARWPTCSPRREPIIQTVTQTDRFAGQVMADHDYVDELVRTLPDAYQVLAKRPVRRLLRVLSVRRDLKVNGKGGQPVFVKLAEQVTGRCTPK